MVWKACARKMTVDIAREDEAACGHSRGPFLEQAVSLVGLRTAIEISTVAVETPSQLGIAAEPIRVGQVGEREAQLLEGGIGFPKAVVAATVGEARIDTKTGTRANEQGVGRSDRGCSGL